MVNLHKAVSELLEAQERFFDAFEAAVIDTLGESDRLALQGCDHPVQGQDRTPLLLSLLRSTDKVRDKLLQAGADDAHLIAKASVANAASLISALVERQVESANEVEAV